MVDGGYLGLAAAYAAVTIAVGYSASGSGSRSKRRPAGGGDGAGLDRGRPARRRRRGGPLPDRRRVRRACQQPLSARDPRRQPQRRLASASSPVPRCTARRWSSSPAAASAPSPPSRPGSSTRSASTKPATPGLAEHRPLARRRFRRRRSGPLARHRPLSRRWAVIVGLSRACIADRLCRPPLP